MQHSPHRPHPPSPSLRLEQSQERTDIRFRVRKGSVERVTHWFGADEAPRAERMLMDHGWVIVSSERMDGGA